MAKSLSRILAIALLSTMVAAGAGATCLLWASVAPAHRAGCHPVRFPVNPQPADYRCCANGHASALTSNVFSSRPMLQPVGDGVVDRVVTAHAGDAFPVAIASSGGPPGPLILRI